MVSLSPRQRTAQFLSTAHLYQLGELPTEQPHPATCDLSGLARGDLPRAISLLKSVDLDALAALERYAPHVDRLAACIASTLNAGRRVYLCGCGATGRLSLSLEFLWREKHGADDHVRSFMAGGDVALVHALEGFEDHPAYGARHLEEMGFANGDLLIACTEGGETPYVIGAAERAATLSSNAPWFLYCNPDAILSRHVERFRRVRENPGIRKLCLDTGPMALTGSTRMQASTILMMAVGLALIHRHRPAAPSIAACRKAIAGIDFSFLASFIEEEARIYSAGDHVTYRVRDFGITVLTDTTERAPTFSLIPFDQLSERRTIHSQCYVSLPDAADPDEAWQRLLNRTPRALDWPDVDARTSSDYLRAFDFSARSAQRRRDQIPERRHHDFWIGREGGGVGLALAGLSHEVATDGASSLLQHLTLKQMLNIHSTLVMGRLGRYEGNLMTWVTPTNGKLVDRAARYVGHLLTASGHPKPGYAEVVEQLFDEMSRIDPGESVVLSACRSLTRRRAASFT